MFQRVVIIGAMCAGTFAAAEPVALTGHAINDAVTGAIVQIDAPLGTKLPVSFAANGQLSGDAGALAFFLGSGSDHGRWWVARDRLCYKWTKWFDAETQCLQLKQEGQRLHWQRDDGKTGTATLVARADQLEKPTYALGLTEPQREPPKPVGSPSAKWSDQPAAPAVATPPPAAKQVREPKSAAKPVTVARIATAMTSTPVTATVAPPKPRTAPPQTAATNTGATKLVAARYDPSLPVFRVAGVRADDVLNVRIGPSPTYIAVGAIPPQGQGVRLAGQCLMDWCPIIHGGVSGWVNRTYLVSEHP